MEDLEPLVTRCPHCSTRFRVSESQLQVAKGRVRCGACLTVFVGIDHLQWDLEQDVVSVNPDQSIDQLLVEIDEFEKVAEIDATSGENSASAAGPDLPRTDPSATGIELHEVTNQARAEPEVPIETESTEEQVEQSGVDTVASVSPLVDFTGHTAEVDEPAPEPGADHPAQVTVDGVVAQDPDWPEHETIEVELPADMPVDPFDRVWRETVQEESGEDSFESNRFAPVSQTAAPDSAGGAPDRSAVDERITHPLGDHPDQESGSVPRRNVSAAGLTDRSASNTGGLSTPAASGVIERTARVPLEAPRRSRLRRWRGVLIAAALTLMAAQVIWYLLPSWISDPEKRWLPEQVCAIAGCKLEPLRDLTQLLLTNVVVRAHPERPEVRQIDLLLVNSGTFDQAFPDIEITFSTPAGDRVAWKRFTPGQYLSGEMKDATAIPRKTPVRISLEVTDPGTLAYAYEITLK